jgi:hypothetical protein
VPFFFSASFHLRAFPFLLVEAASLVDSNLGPQQLASAVRSLNFHLPTLIYYLLLSLHSTLSSFGSYPSSWHRYFSTFTLIRSLTDSIWQFSVTLLALVACFTSYVFAVSPIEVRGADFVNAVDGTRFQMIGVA